MTTVSVTTPTGKTDGTVELPGEIFDAASNVPLMHQVVVAQLAAARQGTHSAKTRGEVRGGGAKPYRQKGTGRARQGSTRAPQFVGGGVVHGPVPHGYVQRTPKKMKAAALRGALSDRARSGNVHVLSTVVDGDTPSTKQAIAALAAVSTAKSVLVVVAREDVVGWKSLRNAPSVHLISSDQLNTYDVLVADDVVFTSTALDEFLAFAKPGTALDTPADEIAEERRPAVSAVSTEKVEKKATYTKKAADQKAAEDKVAEEKVTEPEAPIDAPAASDAEDAADTEETDK